MSECTNEKCPSFNSGDSGNCELFIVFEKCQDYKPIITDKDPVAEVPCSDGVIPRAVHFSSKRIDWGTPIEIFEEYNKEFNFELDVCALSEAREKMQTEL